MSTHTVTHIMSAQNSSTIYGVLGRSHKAAFGAVGAQMLCLLKLCSEQIRSIYAVLAENFRIKEGARPSTKTATPCDEK